MSSARLSKAAALMRSRAEAASRYQPDRWFAVDGAVIAGTAAPHQTIAPCLTYYDDAEHIAGMHPAVALEIASFLAFAAIYGDQPEPQSPTVQYALNIADAYLDGA